MSATARLGESLADVTTTLAQSIVDASADTIGSWLENGIVYYDLGTVTDNQAEAQKWAEERNSIL